MKTYIDQKIFTTDVLQTYIQNATNLRGLKKKKKKFSDSTVMISEAVSLALF